MVISNFCFSVLNKRDIISVTFMLKSSNETVYTKEIVFTKCDICVNVLLKDQLG